MNMCQLRKSLCFKTGVWLIFFLNCHSGCDFENIYTGWKMTPFLLLSLQLGNRWNDWYSLSWFVDWTYIRGHLYNEIQIPFSWPWPYELPIGGDVRVESWTVNPFGSYWTLFNYLTWLSFIVVFNVPRMRNENDNDCSPSSIEINSVTARGPVYPFHICGQTQHKVGLKEKD